MFRASGAIAGYFPTYTLGAAYAVQFFKQIEIEIPTLHKDIASGNFSPIREWLREKVPLVPSIAENVMSVLSPCQAIQA